MTSPHILIAYPMGGESVALRLFEMVEPLGSITLRTHSRTKAERGQPRFDVVLCVVTDEASVEEAHDLQKRMDDIPTIVVDSTANTSIPINGFMGLVSPVPQNILKAVRDILDQVSSVEKNHIPDQRRAHERPALTSRFDVTLSRLGGVSQRADTILAAATRQLAWELRANNAEACVLDAKHRARRVYDPSSSAFETKPIPEGVCRILEARKQLLCTADLTRRADAPLANYLKSQGLNVVAPMMSEHQLVGWLALGLEESMLTDDLLDDLHVATHLLNMTLPRSSDISSLQENPWHEALLAFGTGMLLLDHRGTVRDIVGDSLLLGQTPSEAQSFKAIRNGHIREVIAEALRGNFTTKTWTDPHSDQGFVCSAAALADRAIAVSYGRETGSSQKSIALPLPDIALPGFLDSLSVPVVADGSSGSPSLLPQGRISVEDSENIRRCAQAAIAKEAKSLRMRFDAEGKSGRAVLFFETPASGTESKLESDITHAVEFYVTPV